MTTSVGGITKRITQQGQDRMGRFSWILIKGQNRGGLVIITAYRVSQKKGDKSGQDTSHYNQKQALYKEGELTPDPRNKLLQDLTTLITTHRNKGHEIMLNIDANESWAEPNSKLQTFMTLNDLNDTHHKLLTTLPTTTRQGSKQRIDYMLTTPGALNATKQCGIRSLHEGIISDHVMLFTDIDINHIIGSQIPQIVPPTAREFSYDNTKMRLQFMTELHKIHTHQNIPTRIKEICAQLQHAGPTKTIVKRYNKIDYEIMCSIKAAAKKTVKRSHGYDRSPTLTEAGSAVLFWKSLYHSKTNQLGILPRTESLASLANENLTQAQHHTINDTKKQLQKAKLHLRDCQRNATELRKQWLESVARWKATNDGDTTAAQTLKIMIQKLQNKQMHLKLSRISKGPRGALDYIEIPTHDWYYSPKTNELYHYDNGVFETHANRTTSIFYKHHSLKVPPDDTSKATV